VRFGRHSWSRATAAKTNGYSEFRLAKENVRMFVAGRDVYGFLLYVYRDRFEPSNGPIDEECCAALLVAAGDRSFASGRQRRRREAGSSPVSWN
jgi:hypothetical protein